MWPFKKKQLAETKSPEIQPFTGINFVMNGDSYRYLPTEDITPQEVALLLPIFATLFHAFDRYSYLRDNNLLRHFTKVMVVEKDGSRR